MVWLARHIRRRERQGAGLGHKAHRWRTSTSAGGATENDGFNGEAGSLRNPGRELSLRYGYSLTRLSRNALVTTDTELSAIAAPAKTGDSSRPNAG